MVFMPVCLAASAISIDGKMMELRSVIIIIDTRSNGWTAARFYG
jgi:hypothetical protein